MKKIIILALMTVSALAGCNQYHGAKQGMPLETELQNPSSAGMATTPMTDNKSGSGKVLETMNSGNYTYAKLDIGGAQVWVAGQETTVKVGDVVSFSGGTPMPEFRSKTLNRTFDVVYFVAALHVGGEPTPSAAGEAGLMEAPHTGAPIPVPVKIEGIKKVEGGKTIAETYAAKANLVGKEVVVRGKVVKYNANIMSKNWIHIQDGTGATGTNDLTITTNDPAAVGNTVVVKGTVVTGKDFGAGYKYDVMLENAKITVE